MCTTSGQASMPEEALPSPLDNVDLDSITYLPITDLIETLKYSLIGLCVLVYYKKNKTLTYTLRSLLCDAILDVELRTNSEML